MMLEQLKTAGLSVVSTYKTMTKAGDALKTVTDKANKDLLALQKDVKTYPAILVTIIIAILSHREEH